MEPILHTHSHLPEIWKNGVDTAKDWGFVGPDHIASPSSHLGLKGFMPMMMMMKMMMMINSPTFMMFYETSMKNPTLMLMAMT